MTSSFRVQRALVSVSDKTDLVPFVRGLVDAGVEILSTGGTAKALREASIPVIDVAEYTGSPEIMEGRVKTLHPRVHGGILMRDLEHDRSQLALIGGRPIDVVVVNLYPFRQTVAGGATDGIVIENIDIGGPSMVRSAAKNHARVNVVVDPSDYSRVLELVQAANASDAAGEPANAGALRRTLAAKAFAHTASYDSAIAAYLQASTPGLEKFPASLTLAFDRAYALRYGENPHQTGAFYVEPNAPAGSLARAESCGAGGKELSFNNIVDCEAALDCVREFDLPAAVVVKHANPCGVAQGISIVDAYRAAREADPVSAFGGIVAVNREIDASAAGILGETFLECIIAPSFSSEALELLRQKKNLRLLATGAWLPADYRELTMKRVSGGLVVQDRDATAHAEVRNAKTVTRRAPTDAERLALDFAWRVCKHVKSNAIVFAKDVTLDGSESVQRTVGVGAGQMSRVVSVEIAVKKAGELAKGSVLASDAFFPFPDGLEAAIQAGVTAVAQPGGSVKDAEVIAAADAAGIAMVFTGVRHFRH